MFEYLNSPSTVAPVSFATCGGFAKSRSGDKTFAQQYAGTTDELREIVDEVRRYMVEQGDDVSENELKLYLAIKKVCNIVCVEVNRTRVILHIHLDPDTVKLGDIVIDAREKGHGGTGDLECSIRIMDELDSVKPLLDRAYLEN